MEYIASALFDFCAGVEVHPVALAELRERGLIQFADTVTEFALTEAGTDYLTYMKSADFASKRY